MLWATCRYPRAQEQPTDFEAPILTAMGKKRRLIGRRGRYDQCDRRRTRWPVTTFASKMNMQVAGFPLSRPQLFEIEKSAILLAFGEPPMSIATGTKRETDATRWGKSGDFDRHSFAPPQFEAPATVNYRATDRQVSGQRELL
jgi:hypothetical protein